jgi:hypothetical protein
MQACYVSQKFIGSDSTQVANGDVFCARARVHMFARHWHVNASHHEVHRHLLYCTVPPALPLSNVAQPAEWNSYAGKARAREVHKNRFSWSHITPYPILILAPLQYQVHKRVAV